MKRLFARYVQRGRIIFYSLLAENKRVQGAPITLQPVLYAGSGSIIFEGTTHLGYWPSPHFFSGHIYLEARHTQSLIEFGDNVWANNNLSIICETRITIEKDTLIGTNVEFMDSDFHGVSPENRRNGKHKTAPIHICENVWIGSNVSICKGVVVGRNSVIATGSVVTRDIPENVLAGGVPAKVIRAIHDGT